MDEGHSLVNEESSNESYESNNLSLPSSSSNNVSIDEFVDAIAAFGNSVANFDSDRYQHYLDEARHHYDDSIVRTLKNGIKMTQAVYQAMYKNRNTPVQLTPLTESRLSKLEGKTPLIQSLIDQERRLLAIEEAQQREAEKRNLASGSTQTNERQSAKECRLTALLKWRKCPPSTRSSLNKKSS